ncbi:cell division ATP-binding protein FtsE [Enterococcus rivorum]|uniref:Cell division ATP-binding protein FtsE n=1 Tax=Enterococcus rivorum TaxID=762845 RepID=A0A1E5KU72_9ENTE|nr:ATP-binding cassette domain-containing protein [Enterococcus rivorum]MBP2098971.1 cell division transport system ATP-binding protein [Enterococcus rivorum]OEH81435.1 cell division ATP-binding protein FtsE [Enterococcus rivorum]
MIDFLDVTKIYKNDSLGLKNITLRIEAGEFIYLIGKSGAGKSTFLKLLTLEEIPTRGAILINNQATHSFKNKEMTEYRRNVGIIFQDFKLIQELTVFDNLSYRLEIEGLKSAIIQDRVRAVLAMVGLREKETCFPHELSGGEQQRVAIARACIVQPKIIIADEPTANLDDANAFKVIELLKELNLNGTTVVIATHDEKIQEKFPNKTLEIKHQTIT